MRQLQRETREGVPTRVLRNNGLKKNLPLREPQPSAIIASGS